MANDIELRIINRLLNTISDAEVRRVAIGKLWTMVIMDDGRCLRAGLSSTLTAINQGNVRGGGSASQARLENLSGLDLARLSLSDQPFFASVGVAAINALVSCRPDGWVALNAQEVIAEHGAKRKVALIGHFGFVPYLRSRVGELFVLEQDPGPGDLPASSAAEILPDVDVIAITGMTLANHTLDRLLSYRAPQATVILLGPSVPLSPMLFDYGVDYICGSVITSIPAVLSVVEQGGNFHEMGQAGIQKAVMEREDYFTRSTHER